MPIGRRSLLIRREASDPPRTAPAVPSRRRSPTRGRPRRGPSGISTRRPDHRSRWRGTHPPRARLRPRGARRPLAPLTRAARFLPPRFPPPWTRPADPMLPTALGGTGGTTSVGTFRPSRRGPRRLPTHPQRILAQRRPMTRPQRSAVPCLVGDYRRAERTRVGRGPALRGWGRRRRRRPGWGSPAGSNRSSLGECRPRLITRTWGWRAERWL
jgi:hypothetical protein